MSYIKVANTNELPVGKIKHVEVDEVEILLVNVEGNFLAVSDRCGHQNAPLSKGELEGKIVTCPLHHARFDVTTGKVLSGPVAHSFPGIESAPKELMEALQGIGKITSHIRVHGLETFETKVEDSKVLIKVK